MLHAPGKSFEGLGRFALGPPGREPVRGARHKRRSRVGPALPPARCQPPAESASMTWEMKLRWSGPPNVVNTNMPIVGGGYENRANKPGKVLQNPGLKNRELKWLFLPPDKGGTGLEV